MKLYFEWNSQTMRVIINDKRYGALKTLGERKQAFNEVCLIVHGYLQVYGF